MLGYLHFTGSRGRVQLVPHDVLGLTVCEARLPKAEKSRFAPRRMRKALDRLDRAGCRRLLSPCALMPWYPVVRTRSLWQAMAVPLTLTYLRSQGLDPRRSVVALRGDRMTRSLYKTCLALAGEVSALSLDLRQDDGLVWRLQQELGLPLVDRAGDVTLAFAPVTAGPGVLPLWAEDPEVAGFHLTLPGLSLPESCPELPVLSALLDEGRLPLHQVLVVPDFT